MRQVVSSVGDYTTWLVGERGSVFKGFARRVPDHKRPHQFIIRRDNNEEGVCMDYKNLCVDATMWNNGQKPCVLLKGLPDEDGPRCFVLCDVCITLAPCVKDAVAL
jgi:hypothetical protein